VPHICAEMAAWCGSNATVVPKAVQMLTICNGGSHRGMSKPGVKGAEQNERLLAKNHCHHACMILRLYAADGTAPTNILYSCALPLTHSVSFGKQTHMNTSGAYIWIENLI